MLVTSALVALLTVCPSSVTAFWRLPCNAPLIVERADPIVSPGSISGHVHTVSGGSNFGLSSTFESLRASECTSCLVKQDMSAYWTPQLYFQWQNGSFSDVQQVGGGLIYYLPRFHSSDAGKVQAFPDGLRMLIGNPFLRSYNGSPMSQAIGWNCLGGASPTRRPELPSGNCPNGLRGELRFPSCWSGTAIDSPDHVSHMAYPIGGESGPCPTGFPIRVVTLFYEMMWSVDPYKNVRSQGLNPTQPFVLASGDPTGYGYHGDFFDGWDKTVLQTAIDTCTSDSGVIEYCKVFDLYPSGSKCSKTPDVNEQVIGLTQAKLPGCNPVTPGPANAAPCSSPAPPVISSPSVYTGKAPPPGSPVLSSQPSVLTLYRDWTYQDCYQDLVGGVRALPNGVSTVNKTVEACLDACSAKGYSLAGVQYHGECWCGNTLDKSSKALGYGSCDLTCNDNPLQYCGGSNPAAFEYYKRSAIPSSVASSTSTTTKPISASIAASSTAVSSSAPSASASAVSTKLTTTPDWTYSSCSVDLVNSARSLPYTLSNPTSTISSCLALCKTAGYAVCGLSYGGECYGGASLSSASTKLDASRCAMSCNGDASKATTCGGSASLDVYVSKTIAPLTQPTTPNFATFGSWGYSACYSDLVNSVRSLPTGLKNSNNTVEACLTACTKAGSKVCGLSYYGECWSSTTAISSGSSILDQSRCSYPCKGNPLEWCGGSAALSVYTLAAAPGPSTTTVARVVRKATTTTAAVARKPRSLGAAEVMRQRQKRQLVVLREGL